MNLLRAIVMDTSVFADYYFVFPGNLKRHRRTRTILDRLSDIGLPVYEPFLVDVELRAVLVRRADPKNVPDILNTVLEHVNVIDEKLVHDKAAEIALLTGCRAVDVYYLHSSS